MMRRWDSYCRDAVPWRSPARQLCNAGTLFLAARLDRCSGFRDRAMGCEVFPKI
jgi:hypothetical protein